MSTPSEPLPTKIYSGPGWLRICVTGFILIAIGLVLVALLLPAVYRGPEAPHRTQCKNNLKQIGLALHNYHDKYGGFPPAYIVDATGKPLHSWRTLLLPFLDHAELYNSIDLSKPWDDPVNAHAAQQSLRVYRCPSTDAPDNAATYLAIISPESCLQSTRSRSLAEIADGSSQTLLIIEVPRDSSVPWMSPQDADEELFLSSAPDPSLVHRGGAHALLCDGSVRYLPNRLPPKTRRALITIAAGDDANDY